MVHAQTRRGVQVIAHSMGARVALAALPLVAPGQIDRLILLAAAETLKALSVRIASSASFPVAPVVTRRLST